jgi:hypothetical protein
MSAIWHESPYASIVSTAPQFSFVDVAEIIAPAPESYAEARKRMQAWERKQGARWFKHNAEMAYKFWRMKRPWWLV